MQLYRECAKIFRTTTEDLGLEISCSWMNSDFDKQMRLLAQ